MFECIFKSISKKILCKALNTTKKCDEKHCCCYFSHCIRIFKPLIFFLQNENLFILSIENHGKALPKLQIHQPLNFLKGMGLSKLLLSQLAHLGNSFRISNYISNA